MWNEHKHVFVGVGALTALAIGLAIVGMIAARPADRHEAVAPGNSEAGNGDDDRDEGAIPVKTVHPRRDPAVAFSASQPAYVEAYYRADLKAQVSGRVRTIRKDKGSPVAKDEELVTIEVPELDQEVRQKEAVVKRARVDQKFAEKQVSIAEAAAEVAEHAIAQKEAEADEARYTMEFRQLEMNRIQVMVQNNTVYREVFDEKDRTYKSARSAYESALVAVKRARADYKESKAKVDAAAADVDLKKALVEVSERDRDRLQAQADFARITSPFKGVIASRNVGPGSFVQNATTGNAEALLTVERTDIVTVYTRIPNTYAPYVETGTEALIEMTECPGQLIHAKVTRFPQSLGGDRRMRVEVDLYNGSDEEYQAFVAMERAKETPFDDLKDGPHPFPLKVTGKRAAGHPPRLYPGMVGKMTLVFQKIEAFLLPSSAVFSKGGKPYIYEVKEGAAHLVPVEVQMNNGKVAKVSRIVRVEGEEIRQNLTGEEEIVLSNQGELSEGQAVKPAPVQW